MSYLTLSFIVLILLLMGAGCLHISNLKKVHERINSLVGIKVPAPSLYKEMTVAQGSNFVSIAMAGWIMLAVAVAYFYFFIPRDMPFSYMMQMPELASNPAGFFIFGFGIAMLAAIVIFLVLDTMPENHRNLKLTELYSFYDLSKRWKKYIGLTVLLLWFSILISAWLATIYPTRYLGAEMFSYVLIIFSEGILVWPIWEGRK
jgi:hypothetical protein